MFLTRRSFSAGGFTRSIDNQRLMRQCGKSAVNRGRFCAIRQTCFLWLQGSASVVSGNLLQTAFNPGQTVFPSVVPRLEFPRVLASDGFSPRSLVRSARSSFNPNSEMKPGKVACDRAGARRLRRFSVRTVWNVRETSSRPTVKRPEGRAPIAAPAFNFGVRIYKCSP